MAETFQNALRASENGRTVLIEARVLKALGSPETLIFISPFAGGCVLREGGPEDLKVVVTARSGAGRVFSRALASLINGWEGMSSTTMRPSKQGPTVAVVMQGSELFTKPEPKATSGQVAAREPYWWHNVNPDFPLDDLYQGMSGISIDELCILFGAKVREGMSYEELKEFLQNSPFEIPERMLFIRFSGPLNTIGRRVFTEETCEFYFTKRDWDRLLDLCYQRKTIDIDEQALIHNISYFSMTVAIANARYYIETGETISVGPPALSLEEGK